MISKVTRKIFEKVNEYSVYKNRRKNNISEFKFKTEIIKEESFTPIFFLSTGRTGTDFFTKLLNKSNYVKVFHSPSALFCNAQSELIDQGKIAYETYKEEGFDNNTINKLLAQTITASRESLLYKTFLHNKVYIETNNRITFFAPAIKHIFPNAKFVHLYRHPGEFIRSGIRRKYYMSEGVHESGRLTPIESDIYFNQWKDLDSIEKNAWLWNETNYFINNFLQTLSKDDYFEFNFNKLSKESIEELLIFLDIKDITEEDIEKSIYKPTNIQKTGSFPKYKEWKEEEKQKVKNICKDLSKQYGYDL